MQRDDPYGLAKFGAELAGAKLYKNEKRLVAELTLSRLIGARETERISALLGAAVPDCAVELRAANAAALMAEGALSTVLAESWTHFFAPDAAGSHQCRLGTGGTGFLCRTYPGKAI